MTEPVVPLVVFFLLFTFTFTAPVRRVPPLCLVSTRKSSEPLSLSPSFAGMRRTRYVPRFVSCQTGIEISSGQIFGSGPNISVQGGGLFFAARCQIPKFPGPEMGRSMSCFWGSMTFGVQIPGVLKADP